MRTTILACVALLSGLAAVSLPAQATTPDLVGSRVRVTVVSPDPAGGSRIIVGSLVAVGDSVLSIRPQETMVEERVPTSRVQRFEVRTGTDRGAGARLGALLGFGSGLLLGYTLGDDCSDNEWVCFDRDETMLGGGILGAALGACIGLMTGRGDRWRVTPVPGEVSLMPTSGGGVRLAALFRF